MVQVSGTSRSPPISAPISGCNAEYKDQCYETLEDHVTKMLEIYREVKSLIEVPIIEAYNMYLKDIEKTMNIKLKNSQRVGALINCDPIELAVALHDIGKCTTENQRRLKERCTAPLHEIISATYLYTIAISLDSRHGFIVSIPLILGILLHHHASRSLNNVLGESLQIKSRLRYEDCELVSKCTHQVLVNACSNLRDVIDKANIDCFINYIDKLTKAMNLILINKKFSSLRVKAYSVAVMISGILSILDRYSAVINRSCGKYSRRELGRDVEEFLARRKLALEAREKLREVLGID